MKFSGGGNVAVGFVGKDCADSCNIVLDESGNGYCSSD